MAVVKENGGIVCIKDECSKKDTRFVKWTGRSGCGGYNAAGMLFVEVVQPTYF